MTHGARKGILIASADLSRHHPGPHRRGDLARAAAGGEVIRGDRPESGPSAKESPPDRVHSGKSVPYPRDFDMKRFTMTLLGLVTTTTGRADEPEVAEVVRGNNQFALDLYGQAARQTGNLFFSPYSISTALAMTYAGAGARPPSRWPGRSTSPCPRSGCTRPSRRSARPWDAEGAKRGYQLSVANRLWGQRATTSCPSSWP